MRLLGPAVLNGVDVDSLDSQVAGASREGWLAAPEAPPSAAPLRNTMLQQSLAPADSEDSRFHM